MKGEDFLRDWRWHKWTSRITFLTLRPTNLMRRNSIYQNILFGYWNIKTTQIKSVRIIVQCTIKNNPSKGSCSQQLPLLYVFSNLLKSLLQKERALVRTLFDTCNKVFDNIDYYCFWYLLLHSIDGWKKSSPRFQKQSIPITNK